MRIRFGWFFIHIYNNTIIYLFIVRKYLLLFQFNFLYNYFPINNWLEHELYLTFLTLSAFYSCPEEQSSGMPVFLAGELLLLAGELLLLFLAGGPCSWGWPSYTSLTTTATAVGNASRRCPQGSSLAPSISWVSFHTHTHKRCSCSVFIFSSSSIIIYLEFAFRIVYYPFPCYHASKTCLPLNF